MICDFEKLGIPKDCVGGGRGKMPGTGRKTPSRTGRRGEIERGVLLLDEEGSILSIEVVDEKQESP